MAGTSVPRGIPPAALHAALEILRSSSAPVKRRSLLEELERRGHRISLAGLNRILQHCVESGLTEERPMGIVSRR
jgi:Fe2+ or Zn2+ uptake regulation protein